MQAAEPTDIASWHKRFATEANNRAWDLAETQRTPAQDREMLDAAHASAWHWSAIGIELNNMRASMLLAEVHAQLGHGVSAFEFAQEMHAYFTTHESPDWEVAFAHAIYAHAASLAGAHAVYFRSYETATRAIKAIARDEDRAIVMKTFSKVPRP
jgi:hypothetical protein